MSKITGMVARCGHLKAFITTNDKTPLTDGYVDLYSGKQTKENWQGRVSVQVKGRSAGSKKGAPKSYGISRVDLLAHQKDRGVLYLVVEINRKTARGTAYYALLGHYTIEFFLHGMSDGQKSVSVPLKKLPNDPRQLESILALALKTQDQNSSLGFDRALLQHIESVTVYTSSALDFSKPVILSPDSSDFAIVLNTNDGLSLPIGGAVQIFPSDYLATNVEQKIGSGSVFYEGASVRRINDDLVEISLAEGLKIETRSRGVKLSVSVNLALASGLADRIKLIGFFLALLDTGVIQFDSKSTPFVITASDDTARLREHFETLQALNSLFEHLHVDTHLVDAAQIDESQARQLNVLHRAFVLGEEISNQSGETARVFQPVGPWNLMFLIVAGSAPDKWRFVDPFSAQNRHQLLWAPNETLEGEPIAVTAYDVVEQEYLGTVLNLRLDDIVGSYDAISDQPTTYQLANQRVVALITAADNSELRRDQLLAAASALNDWLISETGLEPNHLINRWQLSFRRGPLSSDELRDVRGFRRRIERDRLADPNQLQLACALLLGDAGEVQDLSVLLLPDQLDQMQQWPIWKLHDSLGENL